MKEFCSWAVVDDFFGEDDDLFSTDCGGEFTVYHQPKWKDPITSFNASGLVFCPFCGKRVSVLPVEIDPLEPQPQ